MNDFLQKILLLIPAPKDFILPSRYPRKKSMIAGWLYIGVFVLGIVCLSSNRWATVDSVTTIDLGYRGTAEVTTTGFYNLRNFELKSVTKIASGNPVYSTESGSISNVPDNKNIGPCSKFVFAWLIINVILAVPQWLITLYHGWARVNPKVTYILTCTIAFVFTLFLAACFVVNFIIIINFLLSKKIIFIIFNIMFYIGISCMQTKERV